MVSLSFPPLRLLWYFAGPEEGEEPSGENVLRLIQIRLMCALYTKARPDLSSRAVPNFLVG